MLGLRHLISWLRWEVSLPEQDLVYSADYAVCQCAGRRVTKSTMDSISYHRMMGAYYREQMESHAASVQRLLKVDMMPEGITDCASEIVTDGVTTESAIERINYLWELSKSQANQDD